MIRYLFILLTAMLTALSTSQALGASEEQINAEALQKTQALLRDPNQRAKAASDSSKAAASMKSTESLVGKENSQETYELSADIFANLVKSSNGDPSASIESIQKNPEEFYKSLTPEQQARIHELSKKIESERGTASELGRH